MKFVNYFSSVTFVMLTADQFVGGDDGSLEQQKRDSYVCRTNRTFPLMSRKNQSRYCKMSGDSRYRARHFSSKRINSFFQSRKRLPSYLEYNFNF